MTPLCRTVRKVISGGKGTSRYESKALDEGIKVDRAGHFVLRRTLEYYDQSFDLLTRSVSDLNFALVSPAV